MKSDNELYSVLRQLFRAQRYGVLATDGEQYPHTTIVCFAPADRLSAILFVTPRPSRKYRYLRAHSAASLFVDNRSDEVGSLHHAYGIEVCGHVQELAPSDRAGYRSIYLAKYPELESFIDTDTNAFMRLAVTRYDIVHDFQTVIQLIPPADTKEDT